MARNFALMGVGGYVAPRHLQAIQDTGNALLAACDPSDSVGILDRYFLDAKFFTEVERFDRFLEKRRRLGADERVHYLSICTPNYLHDAHVRLALRIGADAICEKPLVINPWNLDQLQELEEESGRRVYSVLQLRHSSSVLELREKMKSEGRRAQVDLRYIARRGPWYQISWKGDVAKSGGLVLNIGVHFFDLLLWVFGPARRWEVHRREADHWAGKLELERADVSWYLSTRAQDLPDDLRRGGVPAYRSLSVDGVETDLSGDFSNLHTRVYEEILEGRGYGIDEVRPSIELVYRLRQCEVSSPGSEGHPLLSL